MFSTNPVLPPPFWFGGHVHDPLTKVNNRSVVACPCNRRASVFHRCPRRINSPFYAAYSTNQHSIRASRSTFSLMRSSDAANVLACPRQIQSTVRSRHWTDDSLRQAVFFGTVCRTACCVCAMSLANASIASSPVASERDFAANQLVNEICCSSCNSCKSRSCPKSEHRARHLA